MTDTTIDPNDDDGTDDDGTDPVESLRELIRGVMREELTTWDAGKRRPPNKPKPKPVTPPVPEKPRPLLEQLADLFRT